MLVALVACAACSQSDGGEIRLPVAEAENARELQMVTMPPVKKISREVFATEAERTSTATSDDDLRTQHDLWGRLGFFPRDFDLRATGRSTSAFYGARGEAHGHHQPDGHPAGRTLPAARPRRLTAQP